jgi:hypothetical protein
VRLLAAIRRTATLGTSGFGEACAALVRFWTFAAGLKDSNELAVNVHGDKRGTCRRRTAATARRSNAATPTDSTSGGELLLNTDAAMYAAKSNGYYSYPRYPDHSEAQKTTAGESKSRETAPTPGNADLMP